MKAKCGCEVRWIEMQSGKVMPCDPKTVAVIIVDASKKGKLLYGYTPHWATCPKANLFKDAKGKVYDPSYDFESNRLRFTDEPQDEG